MKRQTVLLTITLILAVAGVALSLVGLTHANSRADSLSRTVAAMKIEVATLQGQAALMDTTPIQNQLHKLLECVPEIQAQVDGMNVSSGYFTSPAGFNGDVASYPVTLNNPTLISHDCQSMLHPSR
jgi:hypothetical protein